MHRAKAALRSSILKINARIYNRSNQHFDADEILFPVKKTLNHISVPPFDLDSSKYEEKIISTFSPNRVIDDAVDQLIRLQRQLIKDILNDVKGLVSHKTDEITQELERVSKTFISDVLQEKQQTLKKIKEMLNNKKYYKTRIEDVMRLIEKDIASLKH